MPLDSEMLEVKQYFDTNHIKLSDCWLENCTEWFRGNNSTYSQKQMFMKIYEQWLLLDLRHVDISILPKDISKTKKTILTGTYSLQLMQVLDLSKPKLYQLLKLRNSKIVDDIKETDYSVNTKRMLQLTLSDGIEEVTAIEYNVISCLSRSLTPGMKIQIKGPITVRRGQILLEQEDNVKLLGGEVEELLVANAYENVLAKDLNMPINLNPVALNEPTEGDSNVAVERKIAKDVKVGRNLDNPSELNTTNDKDELTKFNCKQVDYQKESHLNVKRRKLSKSPDLFDDEDIDDELFKNVSIPATVPKKSSTDTPVTQSVCNWSVEFDDIIDDKLFGDMEIFDESKKDYISIKTLNSFIDKKTYGKHKIKAKFKSILEKLTVNDSMWYMKLSLEDDNDDSLDTLMHNDIITDLIGYTASEMMKLKANVINKDKDMMDAIFAVIHIANAKIIISLICRFFFLIAGNCRISQ